jgi:hypothetical protein
VALVDDAAAKPLERNFLFASTTQSIPLLTRSSLRDLAYTFALTTGLAKPASTSRFAWAFVLTIPANFASVFSPCSVGRQSMPRHTSPVAHVRNNFLCESCSYRVSVFSESSRDVRPSK